MGFCLQAREPGTAVIFKNGINIYSFHVKSGFIRSVPQDNLFFMILNVYTTDLEIFAFILNHHFYGSEQNFLQFKTVLLYFFVPYASFRASFAQNFSDVPEGRVSRQTVAI